MSALPKAVQAQIAAGDALAKDFIAGLQPAAPAGEPAPAPAAAAPAPDGAPAPAAPAPIPSVPNGEEGWEKRYRVLQGKYNAEVPRLQRQVTEQAQSIDSMRNQLNLVMAQQTQRIAQPAPAPAPASRLVTDAEVTQYGADLVDVVRRVAREEIAPAVASGVASVDTRVKRTEQSAAALAEANHQLAYDRMMTLIAEKVPDWETLNVDEAFIAWLGEKDALSGSIRQDMMNHAFNNNDGPRVVAFFKGYQTEHAALNPAPAPAADPAPAAPAATPQPLEKLIAPGTAKAGAGSAPNEASKRIWTQAEIHGFNTKRNALVVARKPIPQSMVDTEREIIAAAREGRVRA